MVKIPISELKPGMKLAKDVELVDGRLLLLAGFIIKQQYITKLDFFQIPHVYIHEDQTTPQEEISEEKIYNETFNTLKSTLTAVREGQGADVPKVKEAVNHIVKKVLENESVFMNLTGIRDIDNYTFLHSVDVCIFSVITGKKIGLSSTDLTELGTGAILHDIGKCKISQEILLKPGKLTDDEFRHMKLHAIHGYDIINNTPGLNKRIANIACQHHEKWDGSGYPLGLANFQIDKFARIVSIADVYDALTSDRVYKKKGLPHEAAEYILNHSSTLFDPELVQVFIKNIAIYPDGMIVVLSTGEIGRVTNNQKGSPFRPIVEIFSRRNGSPIFDPYEIDLSKEPGILIVDTLK